ncbi:MAG TPA: PQQ-dependent sugar dehydrogenase, partial [Nakamurella sp.]
MSTPPTTPTSPPTATLSQVSTAGPTTALPASLQVGTVATGLDTPWGLDFLPDGRAVVTGRDAATVSLVDSAGTVTEV